MVNKIYMIYLLIVTFLLCFLCFEILPRLWISFFRRSRTQHLSPFHSPPTSDPLKKGRRAVTLLFAALPERPSENGEQKRDFPSSKINCVVCRKWMRWAILGSLQILFGLWKRLVKWQTLSLQKRKQRKLSQLVKWRCEKLPDESKQN